MNLGPNTVFYYLLYVPSIVIAITCHEFAHAWVALRFGDPTAYRAGRVSLNPLVHLDPIGTVGILFAGFGWGRPVPVNTDLLRHPRADLLVSAAGPGANLLLACLGALPLHVPVLMTMLKTIGFGNALPFLIPMFVNINLGLAFFNFLPIGPLDGSHVFRNLLPSQYAPGFQRFNRAYGYSLLMLLVLSGYVMPVSILSLLLGPPINFFSSLLLGS